MYYPMYIQEYLHDLLYEFSARRIKAETIESNSVVIDQDYAQFGGKTSITFMGANIIKKT